jgi:hypothetical protein
VGAQLGVVVASLLDVAVAGGEGVAGLVQVREELRFRNSAYICALRVASSGCLLLSELAHCAFYLREDLLPGFSLLLQLLVEAKVFSL